MQNIEELKNGWRQQSAPGNSIEIDQNNLRQIMKTKIKSQKNLSMKYFWAAFVLQIIVYAFLSNLMIRYWTDVSLVYVCAFCFLLYIPFTVVLLKKYKKMAVLKISGSAIEGSISEYVKQQHQLLSGFYRFKRRYELMLVPLSSAIMIWVIFRLYVPGGVSDHPILASLCFIGTLASCAQAIIMENKRNFKEPLRNYELILEDMES